MRQRNIVILLNGPPQCGKDTVAARLMELSQPEPCTTIKFADPIRQVMQVLFPVQAQNIENFKSLPFSDHLPKHDKAYPVRTGRDLMIDFSEDYVKPRLGEGWFGTHAGQRAVEWMSNVQNGLLVVSDCGFVTEAKAFMHEIRSAEREDRPTTYVALWRIHRPGCSFISDSRQWVAEIGENSHSMIANTMDLPQLCESVAAEFEGVLSQATIYGRS